MRFFSSDPGFARRLGSGSESSRSDDLLLPLPQAERGSTRYASCSVRATGPETKPERLMRKSVRFKFIRFESIRFKSIRLMCVLAGFLVAATVHAENWPSRPIKATIPFGAGSAADVV